MLGEHRGLRTPRYRGWANLRRSPYANNRRASDDARRKSTDYGFMQTPIGKWSDPWQS